MKRYIVRRGDSLWNIARRQYGNPKHWDLIFRRNRANIPRPDLIFVGMALEVPALSWAGVARPAGAMTASPGPAKVSAHARGATQSNTQSLQNEWMAKSGASEAMLRQLNWTAGGALCEVTLLHPMGTVTVRLKGELAVTHAKPLPTGSYDINSKTFQTEWARELPGDLGKAVSGKMAYNYSAVTNNVEVSCALVHESKIGGKTFICTEVSAILPNRIKFSCKPRKVESIINGVDGASLKFVGEVACEVEFEFASRAQPATSESIPGLAASPFALQMDRERLNAYGQSLNPVAKVVVIVGACVISVFALPKLAIFAAAATVAAGVVLPLVTVPIAPAVHTISH